MRLILVVALSHIVGWVPSEAVALDNARGAAVAKPKPPALAEVQARKSSPKQPAVKPPSEPAWKAIERRCDAKDIHACFDLAHLYWDGKVTGWWEDTKAMEAFRRALAINKEQARVSQENACDAGKALGCDSLGLMYDIGEGVVQDWAKAVVLYQKACDAGNEWGCNNLGTMYDKGTGVAQDKAKAAALFQKACNDGIALGCNNLAAMHDKGTDVAPDQTKTVPLQQRACAPGETSGCEAVARVPIPETPQPAAAPLAPQPPPQSSENVLGAFLFELGFIETFIHKDAVSADGLHAREPGAIFNFAGRFYRYLLAGASMAFSGHDDLVIYQIAPYLGLTTPAFRLQESERGMRLMLSTSVGWNFAFGRVDRGCDGSVCYETDVPVKDGPFVAPALRFYFHCGDAGGCIGTSVEYRSYFARGDFTGSLGIMLSFVYEP